MDNHIIDQVEAKREECEISCSSLWRRRDECDAKCDAIMKCIDKIKSTMQTKGNILWEIVKVVAIPFLTGALLYFGAFASLQTKVDLMGRNIDTLNALVIELIKQKH